MITKFFKTKLKDKSAQALPEFALCLPLITLMIGMLITIAQLVYAKEVCQAAAQSTCRYYVSPENYVTGSAFSEWLSEIRVTGDAKKYAIEILKAAALQISLPDDVNSIILSREPLINDGGVDTGYTICSCKVTGAIETLFPVQWNKNVLQPNISFINGYVAMVAERPMS